MAVSRKRKKSLYDSLDTYIFFICGIILSAPILTYFVNFATSKPQENTYLWIAIICGILSASLLLYVLILNLTKCKTKSDFLALMKENLDIVFFSLFILCIIISTAVNGFTSIGLFGNASKHEGMFMFIFYVCFYLLSSLLKNEKYKEYLVFWVTATATFIAIIAITVTAINDPNITNNVLKMSTRTGVFKHFNHYGYYLAMTGTIMLAMIIFSKNYKMRILYAIEFILTVIMTAYCTSLGGFVALVAGIVLLFVMIAIVSKKTKIIIAMAIGAVVVLIVTYIFSQVSTLEIATELDRTFDEIGEILKGNANDSFGTERILLWRLTAGKIAERPFFGWGADGIWDYLAAETVQAQRTHNEFLQHAAFFGIPALIFYVLGCLSTYLIALKRRSILKKTEIALLSAAFAYLVGSFFGVTMISVVPTFMVLFGLGKPHEEK